MLESVGTFVTFASSVSEPCVCLGEESITAQLFLLQLKVGKPPD